MANELRKITLNLNTSDVRDMERLYGRGWTTKVRELVHTHLKDKQLHKIDWRKE